MDDVLASVERSWASRAWRSNRPSVGGTLDSKEFWPFYERAQEMKPSQLLFGTDYPQEIRSGQLIADYLKQISTLGLPEEDLNRILSGNGKGLLGLLQAARAS